MYKLYLTKNDRNKLIKFEENEWNVNDLINMVKKRCPTFDDFFNDDSLNHVSKYALYLFPPLSHYGNERHKQLESYIIEREKNVVSVPKNKAMFKDILSNFKIIKSANKRSGFKDKSIELNKDHQKFFTSVFIEFISREYVPSKEIRSRYESFMRENNIPVSTPFFMNKQMKIFFKKYNTDIYKNDLKRFGNSVCRSTRFSVNMDMFSDQAQEKLKNEIKNFKESNNIK